GIAEGDGERLLEVWNKIDRLDHDVRVRLRNHAERQTARRPVLVSARSGEGLDLLAAEIERRLAARRVTLNFILDAADGAGLSCLHRTTEFMPQPPREDEPPATPARPPPPTAKKARARSPPTQIH